MGIFTAKIQACQTLFSFIPLCYSSVGYILAFNRLIISRPLLSK